MHRVREDVAIGRDLFLWLFNGEWTEHKRRGVNKRTGLGIETAFHMESIVALEMSRQAERGFRLDIDKALARCEELDAKIDETVAAFRPHMPMRIKSKPFKAQEKEAQVEKANDYSRLHGIGVTMSSLAMLLSMPNGAEIGRRFGLSPLSLGIGQLLLRKTSRIYEGTRMTHLASSTLALILPLRLKRFPWETVTPLSKCSMTMAGKVWSSTIQSKPIWMSMESFLSLGVER